MADIGVQLNKAYMEILGREIDPEGLETYMFHMTQKRKTIEWVKNILKHSDEYLMRRQEQPQEKTSLSRLPTLTKCAKTTGIKKNFPSKIQLLEEPLIVIKKEMREINFNKTKPAKIPLKINCGTGNIVNVFLCTRDNSLSIGQTLSYLRIIERNHRDKEFHYYVLENDSKDDTPYQIIDFFATVKGRYRIEKADKKKWGTVSALSRVEDMAKYRNMMKDLCTTWENSEYSIILDTGIDFKIDIFDKMVEIMRNDSKICMVTPFGKVGTKKQYYDTYALETKEGVYGKLPRFKETIERVHSAFSGFVVIKSNVMKLSEWGVIDGNRSEHNFFCKQVCKYGDIVCATDIEVSWTP